MIHYMIFIFGRRNYIKLNENMINIYNIYRGVILENGYQR